MSDNEQDSSFLKTLSILYVEDDAETREQLGKFLQRRVGRLITAESGTEGLEKFRELHPRIVVTDIFMPGMDGLEMSRNIRDLDRSVPIIVITAFEQTDYMRRSIEIGVDKYVVKPVESDRLLAALLDCAHRLCAEEQLRQQRRREAEALRIRHLEALNILAGGMAHDFNNLLQAILGFVYLAKVNVEPDSKVKEFLELADNCSAQARELGERLLHIASGNKPVLHTTALDPIIKSVVNEVLSETSITVEFDFAADLPFVTCEDAEIREVITQLTRNSLEAMPAGGDLRISAASRSLTGNDAVTLPTGDYLHVTFADTGTGIAAEYLPKIFYPYFSTKNIGYQKGMGLGLALCDTIIRKHGGMINAESSPDNGAVFHIWLPVAGAALTTADMGANI